MGDTLETQFQAMNRRSLIQLLIGVIAAMAGLAAMSVLRQNRCVTSGGTWNADVRACVGPDGPIAVAQATDVVAAVVIGALVAFMLYRASTFAQRHASRSSA
jgi:hypothetical protein